MKLLWILALAVLAWKLFLGRWPWQTLQTSKRSQELSKARALLGVSKNARREEIIEAHRKLVAMVHPDRGGTNALVHEANEARDTLLAERAGNQTEQT